MKGLIFISLLLLSVNCLVPKWPSQFSSYIELRIGNQEAVIARWFQDSENRERIDVSSPFGWETQIKRYNEGRQFTITRSPLRCIDSPLNGSVSVPQLSDFKYESITLLKDRPVQYWTSRSSLATSELYIDSDGKPLRYRVFSSTANLYQIDFIHFSESRPDPKLFETEAIDQISECTKGEPLDLLERNKFQVESIGGSESGKASWYSCEGVPACGSTCNPKLFIAAHRTLRCGTVVKVVRGDTGAQVNVSIADRGPFVEGRIIDLNQAPAQTIKMIDEGVVPVIISW
eukprot:TRINITY_DN6817_c0_g2_i1.p1 TRINITY_DN6817_c0_g2~~TRINITY_DN6817_c0_g2_i1.p1  ORF type:complete len:288 (+),score=40.68 TRINITY_DN6817_c0_g2_i1:75-938(+)